MQCMLQCVSLTHRNVSLVRMCVCKRDVFILTILPPYDWIPSTLAAALQPPPTCTMCISSLRTMITIFVNVCWLLSPPIWVVMTFIAISILCYWDLVQYVYLCTVELHSCPQCVYSEFSVWLRKVHLTPLTCCIHRLRSCLLNETPTSVCLFLLFHFPSLVCLHLTHSFSPSHSLCLYLSLHLCFPSSFLFLLLPFLPLPPILLPAFVSPYLSLFSSLPPSVFPHFFPFSPFVFSPLPYFSLPLFLPTHLCLVLSFISSSILFFPPPSLLLPPLVSPYLSRFSSLPHFLLLSLLPPPIPLSHSHAHQVDIYIALCYNVLLCVVR